MLSRQVLTCKAEQTTRAHFYHNSYQLFCCTNTLFSYTAASELRSQHKGENSLSALLQQLPAMGIRFELAEERQSHTWELTVVDD